MHTYATDQPSAPTLVLAHGAGAGESHPWMIRVAERLAARGIHVVTFNFPYTAAGKKVPDRGPVLEEAFARVWREAQPATGPVFAGGKSMGGRMSSQAAARGLFDPAPSGLVFFGYPLHPPGKAAQRRDAHLPAIACPMLFLHGTRDPFGTPEEMRELTATLGASATLNIIDGGDHSLVRSKRKGVADGVEEASDLAAEWMLQSAFFQLRGASPPPRLRRSSP